MVVPSLVLADKSSPVHGEFKPEKNRHREQATLLETWLRLNNNNLYPTREQKDKLADEMHMTYIQVNRWFANRRRKLSKRRKTDCISPASSSSPTDRNSPIPGKKEDKTTTLDFWAEALAAISRAGVIQNLDSNNNKDCKTSVASSIYPTTAQQVPDLTLMSTGLPSPPLIEQHSSNKLLSTPPAFGHPFGQLVTASSPFVPGLGTFYHQQNPHLWSLTPELINQAALAGLLPWLSTPKILPWQNGAELIETKTQSVSGSDSDLSDFVSPKQNGLLADGATLTEEESIAVSVLAELAMQRR